MKHITKTFRTPVRRTQPLTRLIAGLALCALSVSVAKAATIYKMDFNEVTGSGSYPGGAPSWNVFNAPADVTGIIIDSIGSSLEGLTISQSGDINDSTGTGLYNNNGPAWVNGNLPADDFFWTADPGTSGDLSSFTITLDNMKPGSTVSLDLFASRNSASALTAVYEYSLDGGSTWDGFTVLDNTGSAVTTDGWNANDTQSQAFSLVTDGFDNGRYMALVNGVLSSSSLQVRLTEDAPSFYAGINAMRLSYTELNVPEPSSLSLLLFGLVLSRLAKRRVRG